MNVTALSGQSVLDLAVQTSGDACSAILMAIANDISITETLIPATVLRTVALANRDIANYYTNKNLQPATALSEFDDLIFGIFDNTFDSTFE